MISRTLVHRVALALSVAAIATTAALACVDPNGDYETYLDKTKDIRGVTPDTGVSEVILGDADLDAGKQTFWGNCLPNIVTGSPQSSIMYYTEFTFTGGKVDVSILPMKETATVFSKSETVGEAQVATGVAIKSDNTFTAVVGNVKVPGNSQRIGDSELVLTNVSYQARILSDKRICGELQGDVTAPLSSSLDNPGDFCVWIAMADGTTLPTSTDSSGTKFVGIPNEEYHCP